MKMKNRSFFKRCIFSFVAAHGQLNAQFLADLIAFEIEQVTEDRHKKLIEDMERFFETVRSRTICAYKVVVNGKIGASDKTKTQTFKYRKRHTISMQQFDKRISYALGVARTYTGLFGVNV